MAYIKKVNTIIVDNCKAFCDILNDYLLDKMDINVIGIANDGIQALKLIKEKKPDLVLLNIIMPNLDGLGVLERLKQMEIDPMPHIIILSSVGEDKIIKRALNLGANHYITKPIVLDSLVRDLREMFHEKNRKTINECIADLKGRLNKMCNKFDDPELYKERLLLSYQLDDLIVKAMK